MASRAFTIHHKKQVFRIICGLFFAAIMQYFFAYPGFYWLPLATLIVMLTKRGNALYQGLLHFFVLIIIVSVLTLIFNDQSILYQRAQDIILGALIGILTNLLIFPDRVDIEFREIIMPILDLYGEYFQNISECILERNFVPAEMTQVKIEKALLTLPTYIYDPGFDITMKKGHQYFHQKIERLSEILLTLHHASRYPYDPAFIGRIREPLLHCVTKILAFIVALETVLDLKQLPGQVEDFYAEITEIENDFKSYTPLNLEILDLEKEFIFFALFLTTLKEFHDNLLLLAKTLR